MFRPDVIWICNPTALHRSVIESLSNSLDASTNSPAFFIEKPLAHSSADAIAIAKMFNLKSSPFFYGCLLRLHPLMLRVKELIESQDLGKVLSYQLRCGSYLPDWRKDQDYRQNYSAKKAMGGGVTLDLIHEFDYSEMWFGPIRNLSGFKSRVSALEIDSDDLCLVSAVHENNIQGQIMLDYFRPVPRRDFEVNLSQGVLIGDLLTGVLRIQKRTENGQIVQNEETHRIDRDALHDRQTELVFHHVESKTEGPWQIDSVARLVSQVSDLKFLGIQR